MCARQKIDSDKRPIDNAYKLFEHQLLPIFPCRKITVNVLKDWLWLIGQTTTGRKAILSQRVLDYVTSNNKNAPIEPVLAEDYIVDDDDLDPHTDDEDDDDGDDGTDEETT